LQHHRELTHENLAFGPKLPKVILVVEDQEPIRSLVAEFLAEAGFEVVEAETGDRALILLEQMARLDALLTDIQMPGRTDGNQVARAARRARPLLPIVYMTGRADMLSNRLGALDVLLRKPFRIGDVLATLDRLLAA